MILKKGIVLVFLGLALILTGCGQKSDDMADTQGFTAPTQITVQKNEDVKNQLRGFDLSNMTLIEGKIGWIVVDPMTSKETTRRAYDFALKHLGKKPITAIIFTHSHIDHFGGVTSLISPEEVKNRNVRIITFITSTAVITDPDDHEKFAVNSFKLVPSHAALDPELMQSLPPGITVGPGMDMLTHAVEAYIGRVGYKFTDENAERAVRIVFQDLEDVYKDGSDLDKRQNLPACPLPGA